MRQSLWGKEEAKIENHKKEIKRIRNKGRLKSESMEAVERPTCLGF